MADKKVTIEVGTDVEDSEVDALEKQIQQLKNERLQFQIDTNTSKLEQVRAKIKELENQKATLDVDADDSEIKKIDAEIDKLKMEEIDLDLKVRQDELQQVESKIDSMDPSEIEVNVENQTALQSLDQIGQGFDKLKQGASEVAEAMGGVLESAGKMEQTEAFLTMNLGADKAKKTLTDIRSVTDSLPGDDVALQNLLSQAALKDASMGTEAFQQMGSAAADYMAAMQNFGKSSTETQQDLMNYILAGNTAEIERSPILQSHVDKLKEGTTIQERSKLLAEALNEEGWKGISDQDIYNNKLQQFNDMLERGKMNFGDMFLKGSEGAMQWLMDLDAATGGAVGLAFALGSFATPIADTIIGIGQMGAGFKALKDAADFTGITSKLGALKTKLVEVANFVSANVTNAFQTLKVFLMEDLIPAAKNAALALLDVGKKALIAGYNAVKSAALWAYQKLAMIASTVAEYGLAAAQAILNAVMSMNPIMIVVLALIALAAALVWAYYNVDWFRQMVDGAWQSLVMLGQQIYGAVAGAIQWLSGLFQNFTSQLGLNTNDWIQAVLGFILFIPQLPLRLGAALLDALARTLGFKGSFVNYIKTAASNALSNFISNITQIPQKLGTELSNALDKVNEWAATLPAKFWEAGVNAVKQFLSALGIASPGTMQRMIVWEVSEMGRRVPIEGEKLTSNLEQLGQDAVDSFGNPSLGIGFDDVDDNFANGSIDKVLNVASQGRGDIIINIEGDVDSDRRINQIVEVIRRELNWDNTTAGRTI